MPSLLHPLALVLAAAPALAQAPARGQDIHASPDPDLAVVDVYFEGALALDDFTYLSATPFHDLPPGTHTVAVAPSTSTSAADAFYSIEVTLEAGARYTAVLTGVLDASAHQAHPDGEPLDFRLLPLTPAVETSSSGHGYRFIGASPDMPTVDATLPLFDDLVIGTGIRFNTATPIGQAVAGVYDVAFVDPSSGGRLALVPRVPTGPDGQAAVYVLTGFRTPADDGDGPGLVLLKVLPDGSTVVREAQVEEAVARDDRRRGASTHLLLTPSVVEAGRPVSVRLDASGPVSIAIYDMLGRRIRTVHDGPTLAGASHRAETHTLPPGSYLVRAQATNDAWVARLTVVR
ncbi:DUF4397 domain-containing protein [Rubrivirga marina]|uniref:DUF4397 domain-containing protein n=1 Tax=Rubrivirga marina TaxID=1196024 RepID=A0A271J3A7_9BACT|nr:DUF4397 domain-containing protein [Rubrivirga marina]PAP77933.1 hypothetical protein BSZ37_16550 [Rubrivirga marina]